MRFARPLVAFLPSTMPPSPHYAVPRHLSLDHFRRVKNWHAAPPTRRPLESHLWDAVLTLWVMGWIGWLHASVFDAGWAYPLYMLGMLMPQMYVRSRAAAHHAGRLRCDWLSQLQQ
jgi:hypothetical protein